MKLVQLLLSIGRIIPGLRLVLTRKQVKQDIYINRVDDPFFIVSMCTLYIFPCTVLVYLVYPKEENVYLIRLIRGILSPE